MWHTIVATVALPVVAPLVALLVGALTLGLPGSRQDAPDDDAAVPELGACSVAKGDPDAGNGIGTALPTRPLPTAALLATALTPACSWRDAGEGLAREARQGLPCPPLADCRCRLPKDLSLEALRGGPAAVKAFRTAPTKFWPRAREPSALRWMSSGSQKGGPPRGDDRGTSSSQSANARTRVVLCAQAASKSRSSLRAAWWVGTWWSGGASATVGTPNAWQTSCRARRRRKTSCAFGRSTARSFVPARRIARSGFPSSSSILLNPRPTWPAISSTRSESSD